jgi:phospholipid-binding lipoprotein MlaA
MGSAGDIPDPDAIDRPADASPDFFEEEEQIEDGQVKDPLILWNTFFYHFNDKLYFYVLKPVAEGYGAAVPGVVRSWIRNFFQNLMTPVRLTSCLLQGKLDAAGGEIARFCLNTTVGILGFGDPARKYPGMNPSKEDLGQTLGSYGISEGFYIVWPIIGPSTLRDSVGMLGDRFLNPLSYVEPIETSIGIQSYERVNTTSFQIGDYESFKAAALDPYIALRDAYLQHRKKMTEE